MRQLDREQLSQRLTPFARNAGPREASEAETASGSHPVHSSAVAELNAILTTLLLVSEVTIAKAKLSPR